MIYADIKPIFVSEMLPSVGVCRLLQGPVPLIKKMDATWCPVGQYGCGYMLKMCENVVMC